MTTAIEAAIAEAARIVALVRVVADTTTATAAHDEADRVAANEAVTAAKSARTVVNRRSYASRMAAKEAQQELARAIGVLDRLNARDT